MNTRSIASQQRSGVIPIRRCADQLQILLITSRHDSRWIIPKGRIEPRMTPGESAAKEAYEEAGVTGRLSSQPLGNYLHRRGYETHEVEVFRMDVERVLEAWPEQDERDRRWFTVQEALAHLDSAQLCEILENLAAGVNGRAASALSDDMHFTTRQAADLSV